MRSFCMYTYVMYVYVYTVCMPICLSAMRCTQVSKNLRLRWKEKTLMVWDRRRYHADKNIFLFHLHRQLLEHHNFSVRQMFICANVHIPRGKPESRQGIWHGRAGRAQTLACPYVPSSMIPCTQKTLVHRISHVKKSAFL